MMTTVSEEVRLIARTAERFARTELASGPAEETRSFPAQHLAAAMEIGLLDCAAPEDAGGIGLDLLGQAILLAELAEGSAGFAAIVATHLTGLATIAPLGTGALSALADTSGQQGPALIGLALPEWTAGGAVLAGDRVTGALICPLHPSHCRALALVLRTPEDRPVTALAGSDALEDQVEPSYCGTGLEELPRARLRLDDAGLPSLTRVPEDSSARVTSRFKLLLAAVLVGNARRALFEAAEYARDREQTGRPIIEHQNVRALLVAREVQLRAAESFVLRAAVDGGATSGHLDLYRQAFVFAGEVGERVCLDAVQTLGGYGYLRDHGLERRLRDAKTLQGLVGDHLFDALGITPYTKGA